MLQKPLRLRVSPANHISDNHQVRGSDHKVRRVVAFPCLDAGIPQPVGHWRVEVLIGTRHTIAFLFEQNSH